jgi:membrane glycosyltransferase
MRLATGRFRNTVVEGRSILKATPPIKRTSSVPGSLAHQYPVARLAILCWDARNNRHASKEEARVAENRWRTVGSIRRYMLLVLMLGQTIVAGWYMKGIMPYQGWAFVDRWTKWDQPI